MTSFVFVDTWAWLALALRRDQHHTAATAQHVKFVDAGYQYITSDYVLSELITQLYRTVPAHKAKSFVTAVFDAVSTGAYRLETVTPERFQSAWELRQKYSDKPSISFVDFTSFVIMRELGMLEVFTGDSHFEYVNLGFQIRPQQTAL